VSGEPSTNAPSTFVIGVDFITVPTRDFDRASRFYGTVLGLPCSTRWGDSPAAEFETGTLTIAVMQSDAFGLEFQPHTHPIALHVEDVAAARAELEAQGVAFTAETIEQRRLPHRPLPGPGRQRAHPPPPLRAAGAKSLTPRSSRAATMKSGPLVGPLFGKPLPTSPCGG
jgi:catechol 2,3-dioxygenase-like lactoylglutathione lyase family enzyme